MYKYRVQYAHADVRETGGELTEETPKGWGTVEVLVDHEIVTEEDVAEVTKQIAYSNTRDDGSLRYTSVGILKDGIELLETNGVNYDTDVDAVLFPSDFETKDGPGIFLGEDEYFAVWGHTKSEAELADLLVEVLERDDAFDENFTADELRAGVLERGADRVQARKVSDDDDDLVISWSSISLATSSYPVTLVRLI